MKHEHHKIEIVFSKFLKLSADDTYTTIRFTAHLLIYP